MKSLILSAAAAMLIFAGPAAFAAPNHNPQGDNQSHAGGHATHQNRAARQSHASANRAARTNRTFARQSQARTARTRSNRAAVRSRATANRAAVRNARVRTNARHANARNNAFRNNNNAFRRNNNGRMTARANFRRHNVSARHHYHAGFYRAPRGYAYRHWSYGERLPSLYFARDYWISNYSGYGLSYPPDGCVWVRYGNDAILIDEDTGEILEVVYGQFY